MAIIDAQRHRLITHVVTQQPDALVQVTILLWEKLAGELILIIGEGGFQSLYSRSLHLTAPAFPWLESTANHQKSDQRFIERSVDRFTELRIALDAHETAVSSAASVALLYTFIDILSLLIGEHLTNTILRSAWGDDAMNIAEKDSDNE